MSKVDEVDSSLSEIPEHHRPRRLADWLNPTGARKAHSLIDKVYKRKNLLIAWERVKANQGAGGVDGGVHINPQKTRIVHVRNGFEFLGYKIKRGSQPLRLPNSKIKSGSKAGALYAIPREKSVRRFKDQIRRLTRRRAPVTTVELIQQINPTLRGWGEYYKRAHVRKLFNRLNRWVVRRLWSHRYRRWRCCGWRTLPEQKLYGEYGLVNLIDLIPSLAASRRASS
jgi:RNA-directed DNA polymerase